MPAYSDENLVLEALDDSHPAFGQLVKQYQYRVLRTIASIISDEEAAQDVAQEAFLSAWSNLAKLKEQQKFGRWLNQIAVSFSKRWLRDQRKHQENTVSFDESAVILTQELIYQRDKLRQEVWEAIDELSADHREAVILHYISGYSYKEISEMLSIPFSTIVGRLQEARNQLRKEFLDMVTQLQLEIDSTVHKFLKEHAKQDGVSIEGLIIRLIERYKRDIDSSEITVRKVLCGGEGSTPSPDGRYLSFINWSYGNLAVHDLATAEERDITSEGTWDGPDQYAGHSVWSPDGKQVAYSWWNEDHWELRTVGLNGSEPRVLYHNEEVLYIQPHGWSQDSKSILVWLSGPSQIVLVSVADGSARILKSLERFPFHIDPIKMSLSPDGRYIAYDFPMKKDSVMRDIFLLATDGDGEVPLAEHPTANDYGPVWMPDGKAIIFASDRGGTVDVWLTQVVDGKPVGEPGRVRRDIGAMLPLGLTQRGSFYYKLDTSFVDVYVTSFDPATGKLLAPPAKVSQRFEGHNHLPRWSPDGKSLAYVSARCTVPAWGRGLNVLVIRSVETGEERDLFPKGAHLRNLRWSPDGRSILCGVHASGLQLIDIQTGDVTPIVQPGRGGIRDHVWVPDGKAIFISRWKHIMLCDLETGREREFYRDNELGFPGLAISPDGQQLAFIGQKVLKVMPTTGGQPRELLRLQGTEVFVCPPARHALAWTPDGRHLLFGKVKLPDDAKEQRPLRTSQELWRIPAEGGKPQKLLTMPVGHLSVHPDGQRIASSGGWRQGEIWVMESFLRGVAAIDEAMGSFFSESDVY